MQDEFSRAHHHRTLAQQMRDTAENDPDPKRRQELLELAAQYEHLANKLVRRHVSREAT